MRENDALKSSLVFAHNKIVDLETKAREHATKIDKTKAMVETVETSNKMIKVDRERLKERSIKSQS